MKSKKTLPPVAKLTSEKLWFIQYWYGKRTIIDLTKEEYQRMISNREQALSLSVPYKSKTLAVKAFEMIS